ncbi:dipeptidase PepE [Shewanella intestini]|uniref:Dipeptidase PepE n=1 Tax=Shewanella intestini TaxID=2017544 RepID=A0ABS5HZF6_9GAMM|nr:MULTISPECIES: dipeptidase PepE [Shewanella]MBR9727178.1 dipeptidase PepE [Shewanella intestini]MRG35980.1 dipeptidase PepE [Shewanella sp. XMDDZSB0408]
MSVNALMLSASRVGDTPYLSHTIDFIRPLCSPGQKWLFIPYAGVSMDYDHYLTLVQEGLAPLGLSIESIHQFNDPKQAIKQADGIFVGGGNTFHLLHELYRYDLVQLINEQVLSGKPYVGWSAGSNITGQSIRTTNDMPIIEPVSFTGLRILPFQLNPHYSNATLAGHNGETRAQRLLEFTKVDPITPVIAIQEGTALRLKDQKLTLIGDKEGYLFKGDIQAQPIAVGTDLSVYLDKKPTT